MLRLRTKDFTELEEIVLKLCMETQHASNSQNCLRRKNGAGGITLFASDYATKLQQSKQYGIDE